MLNVTRDVSSEGALLENLLNGVAEKNSTAGGNEFHYEPGEVIYYQGDPCEYLFEVVSGVVKVYMLTPDGRRQVTGFLFPGQILGYALQDGYPQTAETIGPASLRRFCKQRLEATMAKRPDLAHSMLRTMLDELTLAQDLMLSLGRKTATERVASFFLQMAERQGRPHSDGIHLHLPMVRTDIADYLGLTPETVSRTLGRLKSCGVIALPSHNDVVILERERLANLAEGEESPIFN